MNQMNVKIDTNVPIPASIRTRSRYPLDKLEVGHSMFIEVTDAARAKNLRSTFAMRAKKLGIKVVSLADESGVRVWRTQ
jgi:hypothetical protein